MRTDPLVYPWIGEMPPTSTFHIIEFFDYFDESHVRPEVEASEIPTGAGELPIIPLIIQVS